MTHVAIELEDEGKSDATINRVVSAVSTVLNHCAFDDLIPSAPRLRRRKEGESRRAYFTKDQHQQFLQGCLDPLRGVTFGTSQWLLRTQGWRERRATTAQSKGCGLRCKPDPCRRVARLSDESQ